MFKQLMNSVKSNLEALGDDVHLIQNVSMGLEREGLRVDSQGKLSQTPHPQTLGSALINTNITTDFAENLLEFVTDVYHSPEDLYQALDEIQAFTAENLDNELVWPDSMPPLINNVDEIPIAQYGSSNAAKMKTLYRTGLSHRYGKMMQSIAGIHFNFSLSDEFFTALQKATGNQQSLIDFKSERYLHLMRSVSRFGFLVPYFFGASPLMPKSFLSNNNHGQFEKFDDETVYIKESTSLRLSDIGYSNNKCKFNVSFNSLKDYIADIEHAILTPCDKVSHIPIKKDGEYFQINNHILQIENEYYASIRPKQVLKPGETLLSALKQRGIGYVELRSVDIMPTIATGISIETIRFLQAFLTTCLLSNADPLCKTEYERNQKNLSLIAAKGRTENLTLNVQCNEVPLSELLQSLLEWIQPVAEILGPEYSSTIAPLDAMIKDSNLTPSAKILSELTASNLQYNDYCIEKAQQYKNYYLTTPVLSEERRAMFQQLAKQSIERQKALESEPQSDFDEYLLNYFKSI
ncbi:glutamate--cysteine ligase [Wohlfahrtiimonas larvae]|uniref:Glutamate--cysteine ligase n=1 Tax=Wohlfahrtiimonas larvae TaxID=1157986 RepID=A0ABP9MJA7_9GAMM|nr:glutamate--cysteine ligase [Wohlfahrtiimonas larvae]